MHSTSPVVPMGDTEMKRYEWEFPIVPERLRLQVREIAPEVCPHRQNAVRGVLLDAIDDAESSGDKRSCGERTRLM